jgi:simple sugar transport system ATP-binding protein
MMTTPQLKVAGLSKSYGTIHALKPLDLEIQQGEVIGLIGDNGAGKSTFIKILSGVHRPTSGAIYLDGQKVDIRRPRDAMLLGIETIYQYTAMVPEMSIARNVFIGREPLKWGVRGLGILDREAMLKEASAAIADLGLHIRDPEAKVKELSGGQQQGVAIARAIHFQSKVMIFDEPTNHLSVKETNKVLDYVLQLKAQGKTSIFISHNLYHVHTVSDRIVAMARGEKVAEVATKDIDVPKMVELIS